MGKFENKNVVITGSSEGVGQTIAYEFAKEGAKLFLANRRMPEKTMEMIRPFGKEASYAICGPGRSGPGRRAGDRRGGEIRSP